MTPSDPLPGPGGDDWGFGYPQEQTMGSLIHRYGHHDPGEAALDMFTGKVMQCYLGEYKLL